MPRLKSKSRRTWWCHERAIVPQARWTQGWFTMSTQRYHFLTLIGRSAVDLEAACESILAYRGDKQDPFGGVFNDYSPAVQARIDALCRCLIDAADTLPVVHHATQVDGWAKSNYALSRFPWPDGRNRAIGTMFDGVAFYPMRQATALLAQAAKARRRAVRRGRRFESSYEDAIATAIEAGISYKFDYAVAVVTECLGPSREDSQIAASQATTIPGVSRRRGDRATTLGYQRATRDRKRLAAAMERCFAFHDTKTSSIGPARS